MRALFLGTADGHTSVGRDHSGVLLHSGDTTLLLDCGAAAGRLLLRENLGPDAPSLVWLSHMHSDHIGQVGALVQSLWLRQRRAPLHFFGPAEVLRVMQDWLERCILFPELIGFPLEWHPVTPGKPVAFGSLTLTAFATRHLASLAARFASAHPQTCFDCYGLVLEHEGRRDVYSSDIEHPRDLDPALKAGPIDVLICELTHFPERELFRHLAGVSIHTLWLTHYPDRLAGHEDEIKKMAREEGCKCDVFLAQDGVARET
jgi:ribonuclease BN (tRNA processing enzyme)